MSQKNVNDIVLMVKYNFTFVLLEPGQNTVPPSARPVNCLWNSLKSLIEEHARLNSSDFLSTLLAISHVINEKFHPARLLIYLVNK